MTNYGITHEQLMRITQFMPMKTIVVNGENYLQRYFVGQNENGVQDWLHRFLHADSERHLHSHPWYAISTILCGWYIEEIKKSDLVFTEMRKAGDENDIRPSRIYRIVDVQPDTWTHVRVFSGREPTWFFIDDEGNKKIIDASPIGWWKSCKTRADL